MNQNNLFDFNNFVNILGYVWDGDYMKPDDTKPYSKFWTKSLLEKVKPTFDNGAFWMPYDHLV